MVFIFKYINTDKPSPVSELLISSTSSGDLLSVGLLSKMDSFNCFTVRDGPSNVIVWYVEAFFLIL